MTLLGKARNLVKKSELFFFIKRITDNFYSHKICDHNTVLMIEGFESSGNSFLVTAFRINHPQINIGHHFHKVAHLMRGVKYGIPMIVLIRNPKDAIASRVVSFNSDLEESIQDYLDFYKYTLKYLDKIHIIEFQSVVNKTDEVLNFIEEKINVERKIYDYKELKKAIVDETEKWSKNNGVAPRLPSNSRQEKKEGIYDKIVRHSKYNELNNLYEIVSSKSISS